MKKILVLILCASAAALWARTFAENGKTTYQIVYPDNATPGDMYVLKDLQKLLKDATGAYFPLVKQSQQQAKNRLFVGIAPAGFDVKKLKDQEHCVKTIGDDVYAFGGGINGTRYAVYNCLQNGMGFRFFDARGGVSFPKHKVWELPDLDRRVQFDFALRRTTMYWLFNHPYSLNFLFRNGQNNYVEPYFRQRNITVNPDDFLHNYPLGHTLSRYLPPDPKSPHYGFIPEQEANLWKTHPEYFTMNAQGKRIRGHQYCLSNPALRQLLAARVLENMKRNPQNCSFDVSANDTPGRFCHCPECLALEKKYGSIGGPLFDFMLWFCPQAEKQFPGKKITTLIYRKDQTQKPPKGIRKFPKNFTPVFAPIDDNFACSWGHRDNQQTYDDLKVWCRITDQVWVWYYPMPYSGHLTPPLGNLERTVEDIQLMKNAGVKGMVWEHNVGVPMMTGFSELHSYIALQLFQDVSKDWKGLYEEFMKFEYGKASELMKKYHDELEELRKSSELRFTWNASFSAYTYLTPERLVRWQKDFDAMEKAVQNDPVRLASVGRVRCNLDFYCLNQFAKIRKSCKKLPFTCEAMEARLRRNFMASIEKHVKPVVPSRFNEYRKWLSDSLVLLNITAGREPKPLPKEIFGKFPQDRLYSSIPRVNGAAYKRDRDGAFGWAAVFTRFGEGRKNVLPFRADFEDLTKKQSYRQGIGAVTKDKLGPRGKYKFYPMGRAVLTPDCIFRMGVSDWWDLKTQVGGAYVMGSFNWVTFYASLKFEGEGFYPEDKGKKNTVYCDRIVVVPDGLAKK